QRPWMIFGRNELGRRAGIARDEWDAVFETFVDGIPERLALRGHDGQRARSREPLESVRLIELRFERDLSERGSRLGGEEAGDALDRPCFRSRAEKFDLETLEDLWAEGVDRSSELP